MYFVRILIFFSAISISTSVLVKWLPSTSFNLPINFENGELPCSRQTVVFPETVNNSITIESGTSVSGFILPLEGEILLAEGVIELGPTEEANCTDGNAYYVGRSIYSWVSPGVWSSPRFNKATPDAERVPCYDDVVEFPENKDHSVYLPDTVQIVQGLIVKGRHYDTDSSIWYMVFRSEESSEFFVNRNSYTGVRVSHEPCTSPAGCMCQDNVLNIKCWEKFCPVPSCLTPIQPVGQCCKICGGFIIFNIDQSFRLSLLKERVEDTISSYGKDDFVYHIGRIPDDKMQVIVVEKNEYTGVSAEVVNTIASDMKWHLGSYMQVSGIPLSKSGESVIIIFSVLMIVILINGAIYVYYYKLPQFRFPDIVPNFGRSNFTVFSRFDRRSESVVSLTRRSSNPIATSEPTAFRNPLYASTRRSVSIDESITESINEE